MNRKFLTLAVAVVAFAATPATADDGDQSSVRSFVMEWSAAWIPGEEAETFFYYARVKPFCADDILAFDLTEHQTVIRSIEEHSSIWEPFVRQWDQWTFRVLPDSVEVTHSGDIAVVTFFVDNEGVKADGETFFGPAQGTLLLKRVGESWVIAHEHISLPRRERAE